VCEWRVAEKTTVCQLGSTIFSSRSFLFLPCLTMYTCLHGMHPNQKRKISWRPFHYQKPNLPPDLFFLLSSLKSRLWPMAMATSLHLNHTFYHRFTPTSHTSRNLNFYRRFSSSFSWEARVLTLKKKHYRGTGHGFFSSSIIKANNTNNTEIDEVSVQEEKENEMERPPFDINLAVVLAGFAFEAYTSLPVINT